MSRNQESYDRVLARLQDQLQSAETLGQWQKPWKGAAATGLPQNPVTRRQYQGVNVLALWAAQVEKGYDSPYWAGFQQWRQAGAHVRKGEKGTPVLIWRVDERQSPDPLTGEQETETVVFATHKAVFNALQQEGWEIPNRPVPEPGQTIAELDAYFRSTGSTVIHGGNRACYSPGPDIIQLPHPSSFIDTPGVPALNAYYSTSGHEHIHWTGHESRLNRRLGHIFGSEDYAFEELIAETGSAFLNALKGLEILERPDHAQYLKSWQRAIRDKSKTLVLAAKHAQQAVDCLEATVAVRRGQKT